MLYTGLLLLAALAVSSAKYSPEALADEIRSLPGLNEAINFRQFSGYLDIPNTKRVHYWFVESQNNPSTDPVVYWTNGGPGCSGLLGFFTEQGPFRPNADMTLSTNQYSWNKISNMIFIEQPAGVGFSYATDKDEYHNDDDQAAEDNYLTIQAFLRRFPQYRTNEFHISSESYGGHYMPTLAAKIIEKNKEGSNSAINFKGFAVGNPFTDWASGNAAMYATFWGHQIVDKLTYDQFRTKCTDPRVPRAKECLELEMTMQKEIGNLNVYALDYPVCTDAENPARFGRAQRAWLLNTVLPEPLRSHIVGDINEYNPCAETYTSQYLNQLEVKRALNVNVTLKWNECSNKLRYEFKDEFAAMQPYYQQLLDGTNDIKILVFSGDDDAVCATIGTQRWIYDLGFEVKSLWETWYVDGQTAGFVTKFDAPLTFVTVHGAGHEVPAYKPKEAFDLYEKYLNGYWFQ